MLKENLTEELDFPGELRYAIGGKWWKLRGKDTL
jgi:hypothetical protein